MPQITAIRTHIEVIGFTCNKCRKTFSLEVTDEYFHHEDVGGYNSPWEDGEQYEITLCEDCFYEVMKPYSLPLGNVNWR